MRTSFCSPPSHCIMSMLSIYRTEPISFCMCRYRSLPTLSHSAGHALNCGVPTRAGLRWRQSSRLWSRSSNSSSSCVRPTASPQLRESPAREDGSSQGRSLQLDAGLRCFACMAGVCDSFPGPHCSSCSGLRLGILNILTCYWMAADGSAPDHGSLAWQGSTQKVHAELAHLKQQLAARTADLQRLQDANSSRCAQQVLCCDCLTTCAVTQNLTLCSLAESHAWVPKQLFLCAAVRANLTR